jgi:hypothetical protein
VRTSNRTYAFLFWERWSSNSASANTTGSIQFGTRKYATHDSCFHTKTVDLDTTQVPRVTAVQSVSVSTADYVIRSRIFTQQFNWAFE